MASVSTSVDPAAIEAAIAALTETLGAEAVLTSAEQLREYRDPYDYKGSDTYTASAVVTPRSVEDVQAVLEIANRLGVPLWTVGQGRNNAYGGSAPRVKGSIIVSLREMNRILEVNEDLAYALVEPGVSFFDLYEHLNAGGFHLWPSIPDLGWGSIVGNTLEYGRGYTPHGEHPAMVCGMEVVLASGDVVRTGVGGMSSAKTWNAYPWSFGPSHGGLFFQSNFGIVTKMGVWLMRQPEVYLSGWARFKDDDAIGPLADAVRELMLDGTIRGLPLVGHGLSVGEGEMMLGAPGWGLRFALYGRQAIVEANYEIVREVLSAIPGVEVGRRVFAWHEREAATNHNDKVQGGVPGMELMDAFNQAYGDSTGHLDLSLVGPLVGSDLVATIATSRELYERTEFPYLVGILFLNRSLLHISSLFFDTNDERQTRAAYDVYAEMAVELARLGYPVYRTNIQHMDLIADTFDWGDHAQRRLNELLKDALDPNGILSPGKQGIWPKRLRAG
ncbi:MAG TPA: FAD-binding oxidoreductase [Solirubrobacteraceae bacterium]